MRSRILLRTILLGLASQLFGAFAQFAHAQAFNFFYNDAARFAKYGQQENNLPCVPTGACGAVAAINSFYFLQIQYPGIYDNMLLPNRTGNTDPIDATNFAVTGWQVGANPRRLGYYDPARPTPGDPKKFLDTKMDWINDYAPGTTVFEAMWDDSQGFPASGGVPTIDFLARQISAGEDVEFFIKGDLYHVLTLTGIACDNGNVNCRVTYQDPNDPTTMQNTNVTFGAGSRLEFNYGGNAVYISAAYAESPVPEPSTFVLLISGVGGLIAIGKWHKRNLN